MFKDYGNDSNHGRPLYRPEELPGYDPNSPRPASFPRPDPRPDLADFQAYISRTLYTMVQMCSDPSKCRRHYIMSYFGVLYPESYNCANCDVCCERLRPRRTYDWKIFDVYDIGKSLLDTFNAIRRLGENRKINNAFLTNVYAGTGNDAQVNSIRERLTLTRIVVLPNERPAAARDYNRILIYMILKGIFWQVPIASQDKYVNWYLEVRMGDYTCSNNTNDSLSLVRKQENSWPVASCLYR